MNEETRELKLPPKPEPKQGHWYLITGLIIGLLLGLGYACLVNPVVYEDIRPAVLSEVDQAIYRAAIARVYAETDHLERATSRLALLEDENPVFALGAQAQQALANKNHAEAYALALFASALQSSQAEPLPTETPCLIPTQTLPMATSTP